MTKDERDVVLSGVTATLDALVDEKPCIVLSGEVRSSDVLVQTDGIIHYFKLDSEETYVIYYPSGVADQIGELLSSGSFFTVKVSFVPHEFGTVTFWVYSTNDFISVDGREL